MTSARVTIVKGEHLAKTTHRCVGTQLGGVIEPGDTVLVKINLTAGGAAEEGITVHREVVEEVVVLAREAGAGQVIIGEDASAIGDTTEHFKTHGFTTLAKKLDVALLDLARQPHQKVKVSEPLLVGELEIAEPILQCDKLIGITTLKTHHQTRITVGLKNMYSHIPRMARSYYHRKDLAAAIVDINSVRKPDFTVVDAFIGVEGLGPIHGRTVPMGLIICGEDPLAVDTVCARIMGLDPGGVRHLHFAARRGLGTSDWNQIGICGESIADVARHFATPLDAIKETLGENVEITETRASIPGSAEVVVSAFQILLHRYGTRPQDFRGLKVRIADRIHIKKASRTIVVGDGDPGYVIRGECTPGRLPTVTEVIEAIKEVTGSGAREALATHHCHA